jgi:hypothetical protein
MHSRTSTSKTLATWCRRDTQQHMRLEGCGRRGHSRDSVWCIRASRRRSQHKVGGAPGSSPMPGVSWSPWRGHDNCERTSYRRPIGALHPEAAARFRKRYSPKPRHGRNCEIFERCGSRKGSRLLCVATCTPCCAECGAAGDRSRARTRACGARGRVQTRAGVQQLPWP